MIIEFELQMHIGPGFAHAVFARVFVFAHGVQVVECPTGFELLDHVDLGIALEGAVFLFDRKIDGDFFVVHTDNGVHDAVGVIPPDGSQFDEVGVHHHLEKGIAQDLVAPSIPRKHRSGFDTNTCPVKQSVGGVGIGAEPVGKILEGSAHGHFGRCFVGRPPDFQAIGGEVHLGLGRFGRCGYFGALLPGRSGGLVAGCSFVLTSCQEKNHQEEPNKYTFHNVLAFCVKIRKKSGRESVLHGEASYGIVIFFRTW